MSTLQAMNRISRRIMIRESEGDEEEERNNNLISQSKDQKDQEQQQKKKKMKNIVYQGVLEKRGDKRKNWKERSCILEIKYVDIEDDDLQIISENQEQEGGNQEEEDEETVSPNQEIELHFVYYESEISMMRGDDPKGYSLVNFSFVFLCHLF